jgi:MFS family permease
MMILCFLLLFSSISLTLVAPFLPVVGKKKGLSNTDVGIVIGTSFLTTMVVSPVCGNFLHVGGSRRWLFVGNEI